MAEPVKKEVQWNPTRAVVRISKLTTGDGGVEIAGKVMTHFDAERPGGPWAHAAIEMELDRSLGGVVIRYEAKGLRHTVLVPMGHIRRIEWTE